MDLGVLMCNNRASGWDNGISALCLSVLDIPGRCLVSNSIWVRFNLPTTAVTSAFHFESYPRLPREHCNNPAVQNSRSPEQNYIPSQRSQGKLLKNWKCNQLHSYISSVQEENNFRWTAEKQDNPLLDIFLVFFFFFWPHHVACGIVVPWLGIKHVIPALEVQSLNH